MSKKLIVIVICSIFIPEIVLFLPVPWFIENDSSIIYAIYYSSKIILISLAIYAYIFWLKSNNMNKRNGEK